MQNCKNQCKIDLFPQIINAKGCGRADAQFNSIDQPCPDGTLLDCPDHLFLQINTHHMARFSNQARHRQSKEPHPTSNLQHNHPLMDVRLQNILRFVEELPEGAY